MIGNIEAIIENNNAETAARFTARVFYVNLPLDTFACRDIFSALLDGRSFTGALKLRSTQIFNEIAEGELSISRSTTTNDEFAPIAWIVSLAGALAAGYGEEIEEYSTFSDRQAAYELSMGI